MVNTAKLEQSGKRGRRRPIPGGNVCHVHGGGARHVREAAQRRLLEAADPVAAQLVELALHADDPRVQLAAIRTC